jgi:N-acetylglucosamine kinase-like BadF-type ATPase
MILIADSGSTKTLWSLQDDEGSIRRFETKGFNPYFSDQQQLVNTLNESKVLQGIHRDELIDIYFYGAGCFPDKAHTIEQAMHSFFSRAFVHVELDLLGAARGLLGHSDGFVGILGTGANSGLFVGGKIVQNIDSLGYILGDEGSGCYIGKQLLSKYLRGYLPADLAKLFFDCYHLSSEDIMDALYAKPLANRFCASFSTFVGSNIEHPFLSKLVANCFDDFFKNLVSQYRGYKNLSFNCVGSVAYHFQHILEQSCQKFDMNLGNIRQSPMDGLELFHKARLT